MALYVAWKKEWNKGRTVVKVPTRKSAEDYIAQQHPDIQGKLEVILRHDPKENNRKEVEEGANGET